MSRLKRFLSPQVAELILSSGDERVLESHRRAITVLFCDLRGFTAFSETTEPEEVMSVLREYHAVLGALSTSTRGRSNVLPATASWSCSTIRCLVPIPIARRPDGGRDARAVGALALNGASKATSLASVSALRMDTPRWDASASRAASTMAAVGTVVNLAARLCADAKDGQILIDAKVQSAIEASAETEPAGELTLKGFHRPVRAFNVCGLVSAGAEAMDQPVT